MQSTKVLYNLSKFAKEYAWIKHFHLNSMLAAKFQSLLRNNAYIVFLNVIILFCLAVKSRKALICQHFCIC